MSVAIWRGGGRWGKHGDDGGAGGARTGSLAALLHASDFWYSSHGTFRLFNFPCQVPFFLPSFLQHSLSLCYATLHWLTWWCKIALQGVWRRLNYWASSKVHLGPLPFHTRNFSTLFVFFIHVISFHCIEMWSFIAKCRVIFMLLTWTIFLRNLSVKLSSIMAMCWTTCTNSMLNTWHHSRFTFIPSTVS